MEHKNWIDSLEKSKILNKITIGNKSFHRITTETKLQISKEIVAQMQEEYDSAYEKGGFILFDPIVNDSNTSSLFVARQIIFIDNVSPYPWRQYIGSQIVKEATIINALTNGLLPFSFHTHPTKGENFIEESDKCLQQLNTSDGDQMCSLNGINIQNIKLRLPDILIVGNGTNCMDLFIGFYNGLICPTSFAEHKKELLDNATEKTVERIPDTIESWAGIVIIMLVLFILLAKYPKTMIPLVLAAYTVVPLFIYKMQPVNYFFGIGNNVDLEITLPKISDEIIIKNENDAFTKLEKFYQDKETNQSMSINSNSLIQVFTK
jgi:hypothetical protein